MPWTIADIARALGGEAVGDTGLIVTGPAAPDVCGPGQIAVALGGASRGVPGIEAAILPKGADWRRLGLRAAVLWDGGRLGLAAITRAFDPDDAFWPGRHETAVIHDTATVAQDAWIGPHAVIGAGAEIGPGARIGPGAVIAAGTVLGEGARIHAGARLGARVLAGARLTVQPGAVVGSDGFSFKTADPSGPEQARRSAGRRPIRPPADPTWHKVESLGGVVIGDDVEIGANSTVDAGTLKPTRIGHGTKLDSHVHVGHNVELGAHVLLCGMVGIAGSAVIGDRSVLAGQTGVNDHVRVGSDVVTTSATLITADTGDGVFLTGNPAQPLPEHRAFWRALRRLARG